MDDKYLKEYYESYDEDGRLLSRHGQIEFITTMKSSRNFLHRTPAYLRSVRVREDTLMLLQKWAIP